LIDPIEALLGETMTDHHAKSKSHIPLALLFTDADEQILFVNDELLKIIDCPEAGAVVGEPFHQALGVDHKLVSQLMQDINQIGYVHDWPLELHPTTRSPLEVLCTGVAAYDDRGGFIGADITLRDPVLAGVPETPFTHHKDALHARIKQIQSEVETLEDRSSLQLYFMAQAYALEILLARMGGPRVCRTLDGIANRIIDKRSWPIRVKDGAFTFEKPDLPPDVYATLLVGIAHYAADVIGARMVAAEIQAVDEQMDPHLRDVARQAGLQGFFDDYL
jgi:hypothetical protein